MSALLDKSLDEIVSSNKKNNANKNNNNINNNNNGRRAARRSTGARPTPAAPAGGVQKNTKAARQPAGKNQSKPAQAKPTPVNSDSKVIVSNLPKDVSEQQIKEYFAQTVGPIKRVEISYGPNSQSRGIANVTFGKADGASKAFSTLNGLLVDGRAIKIEIVVGAAQASKVIPAVKSLAERATLPKNNKAQPKSAAADKNKKQEKPKANNDKNAAAANTAAGKGRNQRRRSRNPNARPKKTEAELDSEMADYYNNATASGAEPAAVAAPAAAAPAANDTAMDDNIM